MKDIVVIADAFKDQIVGGAELHDDVVIQHFKDLGRFSERRNCHLLTDKFIKKNLNKKWFIGNFDNLKIEHMAMLAKSAKYLIYEHDYKFVAARNPVPYKDWVVPPIEKINLNFYSNAQKVICLSNMQRRIFEKNLNLENIENFQCSMWFDDQLDVIEEHMGAPKNKKFAVINSDNPTKRTGETIQYCKKAGIDFDLIKSKNYKEFIKILSKYRGLVFMTAHPEPTPRVAIEAKMLNMKFVAQKEMISVAHEDYYHLKGKEMIEKVKLMRDQNLEKIMEWIDEI